jgi:type IV pilus assembly protein PilA
MKNKRGFTLVELLAVIAILAILVLIALPNIIKMYNNSIISTNKINTQNFVKTAKEQFLSSELQGNRLEKNKNIYDKIEFSGKEPDSAEVIVNSNGEIAITAVYENKCYYKTYDEEEI